MDLAKGRRRFWKALAVPAIATCFHPRILGERAGQQATWTSLGNHCLRMALGQGVANSQGNLVPVPGRLGGTGHISIDMQGKKSCFLFIVLNFVPLSILL